MVKYCSAQRTQQLHSVPKKEAAIINAIGGTEQSALLSTQLLALWHIAIVEGLNKKLQSGLP